MLVGIPHSKMVGNEKAVENVTVVLTGIGAGNSSLQPERIQTNPDCSYSSCHYAHI